MSTTSRREPAIADLCPHINLANPGNYQQTPFHWYRELRQKCPVAWHEDADSGVGFWAITRQAELDYISRNPQLFSSSERGFTFKESTEDELVMLRNMLLTMDPPDHIKYRKIIAAAFKPRSIEALQPFLAKAAKRIIDEVAPRGECEFVADVAARLPMLVICHLLGAPESDAAQINDWANACLGEDDPEFSEQELDLWIAAGQIFEYARKLAERYRGSDADNLTVRLVKANVDGEALTDHEFGFFFFLILLAGPETTRTATTTGMKLLMEHPEQLQMLLDDPALIPDAVEEILRYDAPVIQFRRTATQDLELAGQQIRKGDKVVLSYASANHDEAVFEEPERFDITRGQRMDIHRAHRSFGTGEHFCIGVHLARLMLTTIFTEMLPRLRNARPAGEYRRLRSRDVTAPKSMPISFDPEVAA